MRFSDRLTILADGPPAGEDARGNPIPGPDVEVASLPADVQPVYLSQEETAGRDTTVSRWRAITPFDPRVTYRNRVRWDGHVHEIDGDVERWKRDGGVHHLELVLRRVTGA